MRTRGNRESADPRGFRGRRGYGSGGARDMGLRGRVSGTFYGEWSLGGRSMRPVQPRGQDPEIRVLRDRIRAMEVRLRFLHSRIGAAGPEIRPSDLRASMDVERCVGCGTCERVCPVGAISVEGVARVNPARCIGCGACAAQCPRGAIRLMPQMSSAAQ